MLSFYDCLDNRKPFMLHVHCLHKVTNYNEIGCKIDTSLVTSYAFSTCI